MLQYEIVKSIILQAKCKLIGLQSELAKRLNPYEYDCLVSKLQDFQAIYAAIQMATIPFDNQLQKLNFHDFFNEILYLSTAEEQQTITIINSNIPKEISGILNKIINHIQIITSILSRIFDPDSVVRIFKCFDDKLKILFLIPKYEHNVKMILELEKIFQLLKPESIFEEKLYFFSDYKCQFYQILVLSDLLKVNMTFNESLLSHEIQITIPQINYNDLNCISSEKIYVYIESDNIFIYAKMIESTIDFAIHWITTLDELDYYLEQVAHGVNIPIRIFIETNERLIDFIKLYEKHQLADISKEILVSYIGSNYLQIPLPKNIQLYHDRVISLLPKSVLTPILTLRHLHLVTENFNRQIRILVIDDSKASKNILKILLADKCDITFANNGIQALSILQKDTQFDILLIDVNWLDMTSIELIRRLPLSAKELPKIAITAHVASRIKLRQQGFDDLLVKPYSFKQLLQVIQDYCGY